jgi:hypothetical protein
VVDAPPHIGTLRERPLHASLKEWCRLPGDLVECPVEGFVVDLVRDDLLIEVQTRGFSAMKQKLTTLLDLGHRVRIVHPIPALKWIVKVDEDGTISSRRRSPKRGQVTDVFSELVSFPERLTDAGLEIEVVLIEEEEYRHHTPGRSWRRRGWSVLERRLVTVVGSVRLDGEEDMKRLIPAALPDPFTTTDLAAGLNRPMRPAQQMAYCLRESGIVEIVGKRGNSLEDRLR